jgi:hypothetical protein
MTLRSAMEFGRALWMLDMRYSNIQSSKAGAQKLQILARQLFSGTSLFDWAYAIRGRRKILAWEASGRAGPPPNAFKQRTVSEYAKRYGIHVLVETGTLMGDMIYAQRNSFDRLYSIELDDLLYQSAVCRFRSWPHIEVLHGDSGILLPTLLACIACPCLFWLDAHYSGDGTAKGESDTPISYELLAILRHPIRNHVVFIDDARCFTGQGGYPALRDLQSSIPQIRPDLKVEVADDCIRIMPQ